MPERRELDIGISKYAREKVIERLKYGFTHDHLEQQDFEKRLNIAINTQSKADLIELVDDLPEINEEPGPGDAGTAFPVSINRGQVRDKSVMVSIFGGTERKGVWKPSRTTNMVAFMGGVDLDYTNAVFPPGITEINVFCMMGGIEITVPPGVNVENQCVSILGGVDDKSTQTDDPRCPTIVIKGVVLLGGIDIKAPKEGLMKRILKKLGLDE
ncbi:MAG: hypothetical protein JW881_21020 [Spirochaetales bacterium]|nr:hypothetical protein [Spirochaetales bacterium]